MIFDHPDYIQQVIPGGLDHVKVGKNSFSWVEPPKYDLETLKWGSGVKEVAEIKLNELLDRYDFVKNRYERNASLIHITYDHLNDFTSEFFLTFEAYSATESVYIKKWLKYWKRVYEAVGEDKLIPEEIYEDKRFTDYQLDQAREVPIEGMYEGSLRTIYGKAVGLCPFHEEGTPSFTIFTNENKFHCFGCQAHGDAIDFWMKTRNVDFVQAVKDLLHE